MDLSNRNTKLFNLEILRTVAASMVVVYHTLGGLKLKGVDIGPMAFFYPLGSAGVDIFFVISGFVIYLGLIHKSKKPKEFLRSRFRRIIPAYWIATFLTVFFTAGYSIAAQYFQLENSLRPVTLPWLLESLFFASNATGNGMPIVGQGWTLEFEMFFYVLVAFGLLFRQRFAVFVLPAIVLISLIFTANLSVMVVEFILGMLLALLYSRVKIQVALAWIFLIMGSLIFAGTAVGGPEFNPSRLSWVFASFMVVAGSIFLPQTASKKALVLGAASYAVYLLHALTYPLVNFGFGKLFPVMNLGEVIACVIVSLVIAQLVGMFFEAKVDVPIRKYLLSKGL